MSYNFSEMIVEAEDPLFWSRPSPVNCSTIRIIGIFLCLGGFIGIILNGFLVYSFIRYKTLRSPPNIFVMLISIIGLLASFVILPSTGVSSIYCYWLFNRGGCQVEAVMAFLYGCSSSYLLCAVSLSRCYIIIKPFNAKNVTVFKCVIIGLITVLICFIWTMFPIMGWNEYTMEGVRTSCCVNWFDRRPLFISFNLFLFIFVYLIPLIILLITNTIIYTGLKRMKNKILQGGKSDLSQKRIEMERRILKSILITISGFVFTWTPYAIIFFISSFRGINNFVSPLTTFICACFAKSSVMWIPILYITTSKYFKFNFVDKEEQITTTDQHIPSIINQQKKDFTPIDEHSNL